jgi:hypothetical protein
MKRRLPAAANLRSVYRLDTGAEIWIITATDRSVTTILLPEEEFNGD